MPAFFFGVSGWAAGAFGQPLGPAADAPSRAVSAPATPTTVPTSTPGLAAFVLEVNAPDDIRSYLLRHLELQRYRTLTDLDDSELDRLLVAAERNTRELLATLGYFSPTLTLASREATATAPRTVTITAQSGAPTRVTGVDIAFDGPIRDDATAAAQRGEIRALWGLRPGMRFTQADWDAAKSQALRQLTQQRYPAGTVAASQADVDTDTDSAMLSLKLDSGPVYRLGPLVVSGVQRYDPTLVERLARLTPGAEYDQIRLLEAQQRLADSGYFDSVLLSLDTAGDPAAAPVRVQVREARLQKLVLGIGASTDSGPRLSAEHTHHQLPGIGWRAITKLSLDRKTRSLGTELVDTPDERGWRWLTSALVEQQINTDAEDVKSQRYRFGRTNAGDRIDRNVYLQYDTARTTNPAGVSNTAQAISANYAWTQRHFDSVPFPTRGYGLGVELGGGVTLGSSHQPFLRTQARWLGVWTLADEARASRSQFRASRIVVRAEGGAVLAREQTEIPETQRFLTGGDTTVRGYGLRDIGVALPGGKVAAGRYLAVGSVEWQRPITVNDRLTDWEGALFVDAGAVADKPADLRARVGVGAGARWRSPVGPLQIDVAYGVTPKRLRLHLSVGFTF